MNDNTSNIVEDDSDGFSSYRIQLEGGPLGVTLDGQHVVIAMNEDNCRPIIWQRIQVGDRLIMVNNIDVTKKSLQEVASLLCNTSTRLWQFNRPSATSQPNNSPSPPRKANTNDSNNKVTVVSILLSKNVLEQNSKTITKSTQRSSIDSLLCTSHHQQKRRTKQHGSKM